MTQQKLKKLLSYNPITGLFTWKLLKINNQVKVGDIAGTVNKGGYIEITINGVKKRAHRLAFLYMNGYMPKSIDHINQMPSDNRWINLREVTHQENCKNRKKRSDNKSGQVGVYWSKSKKIWVASINVNKKQVYLGGFVEYHEAVNVRKLAEVTYGYHENHGKGDSNGF